MVFGGEFDGPDAPTVAAEDALDFAFLDGPDFDGAVLGGGGEEGGVVVGVYGVDVFVVGFAGVEGSWGLLAVCSGCLGPWDVPSFYRSILRTCQKKWWGIVQWVCICV